MNSEEQLNLRVTDGAGLPVLVYLPGMHGDWTLNTGFRLALAGRLRLAEITYPRSLDWSVPDYAEAVGRALARHNLERGWLLAESWGSQVAWELAARSIERVRSDDVPAPFTVEGLVLAGGFVKHPWRWGPGFLRRLGELESRRVSRISIGLYRAYASWRHGRNPEIQKSLREFANRRTELDRRAMRARLKLLDDYDPRPIAVRTRLPVYYLGGLVDPLVPWVLVRHWLRRHCPGYRGGKIFWLADHNILATAPKGAAEKVIVWMKSHRGGCNA
jgi:pimeloyl-ACP methyl ester carboxylesterase